MRALHRFARDDRGAAQIEYVIVLSLVALGLGLATLTAAGLLLSLFRFQEAVLLLPIP